VRHATSDLGDAKLSDFDRTLNEKGLRDAQALGKALAQLETFPDQILASPAIRAKTTAKLIAKELRCMEKIVLERPIYEATRSELLHTIGSIEDQHNTVILVGHNPSLADLGHHLVNFHANFAPCTLLEIDIDIDTWKDIEIGDSKLQNFYKPQE